MKTLLLALAIADVAVFCFWAYTTRGSDNADARTMQAMAFFLSLAVCVIVDLVALLVFWVITLFRPLH